jgi:hypothetical protein
MRPDVHLAIEYYRAREPRTRIEPAPAGGAVARRPPLGGPVSQRGAKTPIAS